MRSTLIKLIRIIKTSSPTEVKVAQKEVEKIWNSYNLADKDKQKKDFTVFLEALKDFDNIKDIKHQAYFINTLKWPLWVIGREYFEIWVEFFLEFIQHPSGKIRQAVINSMDYLFISIAPDDKYQYKNIYEENVNFFCGLVQLVEGLLGKYDEPKFRRYKYVSSMPVSVYKSLQILMTKNLLRSEYYIKLYEEWYRQRYFLNNNCEDLSLEKLERKRQKIEKELRAALKYYELDSVWSFENIVEPGQTGSFYFKINTPEQVGKYNFKIQVVRQEGYGFYQVGNSFWELVLSTEESELKEDIVDDNKNIEEKSLKQEAEEIIEGEGENVEEVIEKVKEIISKVKYFGGSSNSVTEEVDEEEEIEVEDEVILPEISLDIPTSSPYYTYSASTTIEGSFNSSTSQIWVNSTSSSDLVMDFVNYLWQIPVDLEIATNTFEFIGWDEDLSVSSSLQSMEIVRLEEVVEEIVLPEISLTFPTSTYSTTSTEILIQGTFNSSTEHIWVGSTSTLDLLMNTSTFVWEYSATLESNATNTFSFQGWDEDLSASSSIISIDVIQNVEEVDVDEEPPEFVDFSAEAEDDSLLVTHEAEDDSGVGSYDVQFLFLSDFEDPANYCTEENSIYEPAGSNLLQDFSEFMNYYEEIGYDKCLWFYENTSSTSSVFILDEDIIQVSAMARVRAIDTFDNVSEWQYSEEVEWGGGPVLPPMPTVKSEGRVVISEIAWMGTQASANDEWIEICNAEINTWIDINNWILVWGDKSYEIQGMPIMPYEACLVLERTDQTTISNYDNSLIYTGALGNGGENIILYSSLGNIMDQVDASAGWFAGDNENKESMVRVNPYLPGSNNDNWCSFNSCSGVTMKGERSGLDAEGNEIQGSPGDSGLFVTPML